ncbi:hypothetical protein Tco_0857676 [Tanacetum coccineum]|uniref:Uncharacterized protein n=1 Tax=Tanacetum coccineum TaxID=301880 RepID=A0ABQ5BB51_9ASTR
MIVYFDGYTSEQRDFALQVNRLIGEMNEACGDRIAFVWELRSVAGETVPTKTHVFLEEMIDKEGSTEWQLRDLEKEAKERVHEIKFFVGKLMQMSEMAEFMKETQGKDIPNLMKLQILGREFELRAREKDLFIEKLKAWLDGSVPNVDGYIELLFSFFICGWLFHELCGMSCVVVAGDTEDVPGF